MSEETRADEHDSHEGQCPACGECTCVECGCQEPPSGLIHIEFGLQPFRSEPECPKCRATGIRVVYHSTLILNVGIGEYPCGSWYRSGILTDSINEHLCLRCGRCNYGWPTQTADTWQPPVEDDGVPLDPEGDPL